MTNDKLPQYRDKRLQQFVAGYRVRDFQSFERQLKKRLAILEDAQSKDDLRLLPSTLRLRNIRDKIGGKSEGEESNHAEASDAHRVE
jgi:plasmid maintenance system killer protein